MHRFCSLICAAVIAIGAVSSPRADVAAEDAESRAEQLQAALNGADRIEVRPISFGDHDAQEPIVIRDAKKIAAFVSRLEFNDKRSGFYCLCPGDTSVRFFKGDQPLLRLSHHHGRSLRWNGGPWEGDSLFTAEAADLWRRWFKDNGVARFDEMHQEQLAREKREQAIHARFLSAYKPGAEAIFNRAGQSGLVVATPAGSGKDPADGQVLSPPAKKLSDLYEDGAAFGAALAKSLGELSAVGEGSWTVSTPRERLVLECSSALGREGFKKVLASDDETVLLGAARLFFFEKLSRLLPEDDRPAHAARLCEVVLKRDQSDNADLALRSLRRYPSKEARDTFERVASGKVAIAEQSGTWDEPSPRYAALLFLAEADAPRAKRSLPANPPAGLSKSDQAAITIARSLCGEGGLIGPSIFAIDSYSIGYGALEALEREGDKNALHAVIVGGTTHSWAAIREEAVLTAERMTGKRWYQNKKHERAEWHAKDIRAWWEANRGSFVMPKR